MVIDLYPLKIIDYSLLSRIRLDLICIVLQIAIGARVLIRQ
ncbi:protein of unknown function [Candidatus Nitrosacidococcus tergens]|uniref:Uncharacterized protein n=1 Tax=Candidatus Nitrosacidococcus tergens TaxID=553981 RepID=A0A7G1Q736_9GAMM|nr:protein of unknown function [Candidatus Nitrosacidococcus tergens]